MGPLKKIVLVIVCQTYSNVLILLLGAITIVNITFLSSLHIVKVLGQRGPAGSKRPAFTPTQQSPNPVLLEIILTHGNIHLHRGVLQTHPQELCLIFIKNIHLTVLHVLIIGSHQSHSANVPWEDNRVL